MKKILTVLMVIGMMFSISLANEIGITFNGENLICDVPPVKINNRVMVPIRAISEKAGATVDFNYETNEITLTNEIAIVKLTVNSNLAYINGAERILDVPATEINNRTLVPIRFVGESLGLNVDWINETVVITTVKEVEMPNLSGKTLQEAQSMLESLNLMIKKVNYQESSEVKRNYIISQYPVAGIKVRENLGIVELNVSVGQTSTTVPNVVNLSLEEAKQRLDDAVLRFSISEEYSDTVPEGYVIRQNPTANYIANAGSIVELYVSNGPEIEQAKVPNLIGMSQNSAKSLIRDSGFVYGMTTYETDKTKANGIVLAQSIKSGNLVEKGTIIDIVVNYIETNTNSKISTQKVFLNLSNKGTAGKEFMVMLKLTDNTSTNKVIYEEKHSREDGSVFLDISGSGQGILEIYIDGTLNSTQQIKFN